MSERWRVGRHFPIHIYEGEDVPVATALTVAYAKQIVADHNSALASPQPDALKLAEEALRRCEYAGALDIPLNDTICKQVHEALAAVRKEKP